VNIVWLIGSLSKESNCFTSFKHMGHLTLLFLDKIEITDKIPKDRVYRKYVHNVLIFLVPDQEYHINFYKASINLNLVMF
jgi:hypothetical protein